MFIAYLNLNKKLSSFLRITKKKYVPTRSIISFEKSGFYHFFTFKNCATQTANTFFIKAPIL